MKVRYLIVDDEPLARKLIASYMAKVEGFELVGECGDAIQAGNILRTHAVDLIFLDIQMPEISGLEFIGTLRHPPAVILTTAFRHFAPEAFDLDVVDYLLKPISFERLLKAVNKFAERKTSASGSLVATNDMTHFIYIKADRKMHKIVVDEIVFIESFDEYVKVHVAGKVIVSRENISALEEKLTPHFFIRTHRSFLVSAKHITSVSSEGVEAGGRFVPFGRAFKVSAMAALGIRGK